MSSIEPVSAVGSSGGGTSAASTGVENPGAVLDRDAFLKLLVAQLKYQDPTKPADASQMLAQSAQLTMVDRLNDLVAASEHAATTQQLSLAGTIVGKDITFLDPDGWEVRATAVSARTGPDGVTFLAGGYEVPLDAITAVLAPEPAPEPATTGSAPT